MLKTKKGITLVALIITIIVLLILAVVAIGAIQNDGIIEHAKNARDKYEQAQANEQALLDSYLAEIEGNLPNGENGTEIGKATVGTTVTKNSTIDGKAYSSTNPIIPAGFKAINEGEAVWDAEAGPNVDKGLVIQDDNGNEFVWVPLETTPTAYGLNSNYRREPDVVTGVTPSATVDSASGEKYDAVEANLTKAGVTDLVQNEGDEEGQIDAYDFKKQLENEFNLMAASIEEYKGFYVGRYEVSISSNNTAESKGSTEDVPVYSATSATTSADTWYGLYALCKRYTNGKVKSTMIWGSQYNAMMTWMGDDAENFDTNKRNTDSQRRTGLVATDVIRNVYDLGGNSFEWTLEATDTRSREFRGGSYNEDSSPSFRRGGNYPPTLTTGYDGSRLTLYVEL